MPFVGLLDTVALRTAVHISLYSTDAYAYKMCNFSAYEVCTCAFCLWIQKRACRSNVLLRNREHFRWFVAVEQRMCKNQIE